MDTEEEASSSPPPSPSVAAAGPSDAGPVWRLSARRSRKTGSGNIFGDVNLRQLQRLFRAAGDRDAEQRAQLVWRHRDEAELAHALIGLRARSRHRNLRVESRDGLGPRWLRAFNHMKIEESSGARHSDQEAEGRAESPGDPESPGTSDEGHGSAEPSERPRAPAAGGSGLSRAQRTESDPERYLHRIHH